MHPADARLSRLAEFYGIGCEPILLEKGVSNLSEYLERSVRDRDCCLVINPPVIREWLSTDAFPADLASHLVIRFPFVFLHNLDPDPFCDSTVRALSECRLGSIRRAEGAVLQYEVASNANDVCDHFSGLTFGPIDSTSDRIMIRSAQDNLVQPLISIAGQPFFAKFKRENCTVFFLAGAMIPDLDAETNDAPLTRYFSRLIPPAMVIRNVFREECWRPNQAHATLIIDDPLLRRNYGFLNYSKLRRLTDEHNFHTTIAFIPHNFRRSSAEVVRMFRERPDRLSICYHGNDHTGGEFAETDLSRLNAMISCAEARMEQHSEQTGIDCKRVMVFPQGNFSTPAMKALRAHNFVGAVNSVARPVGETHNTPLFQVIQPAVVREGFPLFLRKYVKKIQLQDVAHNIFFGQPVLIVEHHEIFKDPRSLVDLVTRINRMVPGMHWCDLQTAISSSYLTRRGEDGVLHVRAFASAGRLQNRTNAPLLASVEWKGERSAAEEILLERVPRTRGTRESPAGIHLRLGPGESEDFKVNFLNNLPDSIYRLGYKWKLKALVRRRLSEVRDNYLSKSPVLLSTAKTLQRRLGRGWSLRHSSDAGSCSTSPPRQ